MAMKKLTDNLTIRHGSGNEEIINFRPNDQDATRQPQRIFLETCEMTGEATQPPCLASSVNSGGTIDFMVKARAPKTWSELTEILTPCLQGTESANQKPSEFASAGKMFTAAGHRPAFCVFPKKSFQNPEKCLLSLSM